MGSLKHKATVVVATVAAAAAVAAGAAFAITGERGEQEQAMLADVAATLGVEQEALEDAIRGAQTNRVDAAETDGTLSEERADRVRERIESEQTPLLAVPGRGHHRGGKGGCFGKGAVLEAAAGAFGVTASELKELLPGSSLTAIAEDKGVPVEDVTTAIVTAWEERIDQKLADDRISEDRAATLKDGLADRADTLVERTFPERGERGFRRHGKRGWGHHKNNNSSDSTTTTPAPAGEAA